MALPDIAEIGYANDPELLTSDRRFDHGAGIALHGFEEAVGPRRVEIFEIEGSTAGDFIGDRRLQETDRRSDTRPARHDDPLNAELFGEMAGMQRRRTAKGDHRALADILAALDGMDARRIGHVLFDDLGDAGRRPDTIDLERIADRRLQCFSGARFVERDLP